MGTSKSPGGGGGRADVGDLGRATLVVGAVLANIGLLITFVVAMWKRAAKTRRNKEECRQLTPRVAWLRELLQLLSVEPRPPTGSVAVEIRVVLAKMLEATLNEAERRVEACARRCCLSRFFRCYQHARQLDFVSKSLDEVYDHILPVVIQIDTAQRLLHVLDVMQLQVSQDGPKSANRPSETHQARIEENKDVSEQQAAPDEHDLQQATAYEIQEEEAEVEETLGDQDQDNYDQETGSQDHYAYEDAPATDGGNNKGN